MENQVYEFWFNHDTFESAAKCMSLHETKKGARKALRVHKKELKEAWNRFNKSNNFNRRWDEGRAWGVRRWKVIK